MFFTYKNQNIFAFSDTHGMHLEMTIPKDIDILICAGDAISDFSTDGLTNFFEWYASCPAKLRIFIAGNHEIVFDLFPEKAKSIIPKSIVLLEDESIKDTKVSHSIL